MRTIGLILLAVLCSTNAGVRARTRTACERRGLDIRSLDRYALALAAGPLRDRQRWFSGNGPDRACGFARWRTLAFVAGWLTLSGALVSPLHWLGEHLFTFHMIEHEILMADFGAAAGSGRAHRHLAVVAAAQLSASGRSRSETAGAGPLLAMAAAAGATRRSCTALRSGPGMRRYCSMPP